MVTPLMPAAPSTMFVSAGDSVAPSVYTVPLRRYCACKILAVPLIAPATPFAVADLASDCRSTNLGIATAARMPRIKITITSSISVKPLVFFSITASLDY